MVKRKAQKHYCDMAEALIAEQQARLDAIAVLVWEPAKNEMDEGRIGRAIEVLARGKPRREVARLCKAYGTKEKKR